MTTATYPLTFPSDAGVAGQVMVTNGSSAVSWSNLSGTKVVQTVYAMTGSVATGTTAFSNVDNTIPTTSGGAQYMSQAITPQSSAHNLNILVIMVCSIASSGGLSAMGLFQDSNANALQATSRANVSALGIGGQIMIIEYDMTAGTTSSTTFKVYAGGKSTNTFTINGDSGTQLYGGVSNSAIIITEYVP